MYAQQFNRAEVIDAYQRTGSGHRAAAELGCSNATVYKILRATGVKTKRCGHGKAIQFNLDSVVRAYHRCKSAVKVARMFKCDMHVIYKHLQQAGIKPCYERRNPEGKGYFPKGYVPFQAGGSAPWVAGEKNPHWNGGISFEPYPPGWTATFKKSIRQRDGYKCRLCEKSQQKNGRALSVHHIDYDKENLDPRNLISLCAVCHGKTNGSRQKQRRHWTRFLRRTMKGVA